jgi:argininosuccinate lyase
VALEHARALASKAFGQAQAIAAAVHNTPFGDIVDTEDDLQPLVGAMFTDAGRAIGLIAAAMGGAEFDVAAMAARAREGGVTVTELADTLAREHGMSFRKGHEIAAAFVGAGKSGTSLSDLLAQVSRHVVGREIRLSEPALARVLSPEHFVAVRTTPGGPAAEVVTPAIEESRRRLATDHGTLAQLHHHLLAARQRRHEAAAAL